MALSKKHQAPFKDNQITLARFGGLNMVKQKGNYHTGKEKTFHGAPERFGMYAYIFPFIDLFLASSTKSNEIKAKVYKKFQALDGFIWTHLAHSSVVIHDTKGSWNKVAVKDMPKQVRKALATDSGAVYAMIKYGDNYKDYENRQIQVKGHPMLKNPYTYICKDHLEVFLTRETIINS